jgi:hypothetical protein
MSLYHVRKLRRRSGGAVDFYAPIPIFAIGCIVAHMIIVR